MPVPSKITDLSVNEGSNHPLGTENVGSPGSVDNYFRSIQAIMRAESLTKSWEIRGDVPTFISGTSFSIPGNQGYWYKVPRRVAAVIATGYVFGVITASVFNGVITTVTILPDSGALDPTLSAVWLGTDPLAIDQTAALSSGVLSFNARTGVVTLTDADIAGLGAVELTGHLTATTGKFNGGLGSLYYAPLLYFATIGGTITINFFNGQEQNLGLSANTIITSIENMVGGSIMRIIFNATDLYSVTWPANLYWPMGVTPNLGAGPQHAALVTLHYAGSGAGSGISQGGTLVGYAQMY